MAKMYVGINGVAREVSKMYIGVNGVAREVANGYVGKEEIARIFLENSTYLSYFTVDANATSFQINRI